MNKKILSVVLSLALVFGAFIAPVAKAQNPVRVNGNAGMYYSSAYNQWTATVFTGFTGTGSQTMSMLYGYVTLPDGRPFVPFSTTVPLQVDVGANAEVVTPSAVSGCAPLNPNQGVCQVTATFSNAHGNSTLVSSGDGGIMEAVLDAGNNGGGLVYWTADTGIVTLNTGSVTTTTTVKVPSVYISLGCAARVTTTITTSTSWAVGISGATTAFCTAQTTLTAGTVANVVALNSPTYAGTGAISLTAILFTMGTGAPGAGALKARVWGYTPVQPNS